MHILPTKQNPQEKWLGVVQYGGCGVTVLPALAVVFVLFALEFLNCPSNFVNPQTFRATAFQIFLIYAINRPLRRAGPSTIPPEIPIPFSNCFLRKWNKFGAALNTPLLGRREHFQLAHISPSFRSEIPVCGLGPPNSAPTQCSAYRKEPELPLANQALYPVALAYFGRLNWRGA